MYFRFRFQYTLLALPALVSIANGMFMMVESVDGSFIPLFPRAPGEVNPVILRNNEDISYLATVQMGSPLQQVPMAPSLSQDLIAVASPASGVDNSSYYNPQLSSTYTPTNDVATVSTVSDGSFTGRIAGETCALQSSVSTFTYNASVVVTDTGVRDLYPPGANGILGYGISNPSTLPQNASLVQSFLPANFTNAVCGIELNHRDDPVPNGILTMGAVDTTAFTGAFTNVLVPPGAGVSWSIPFDKLSFVGGGTPYDVPGLVASIDIIHTGIQVPTHVAQKIYSCIPGTHRVSETVWTIPCNSTFPITLTFGGKPFTIQERDTIRKHSNGTCYGVVTGGAKKVGQVGAPFLRNFYTQFGVNKTSDGSASVFVGFATKKLREK